jgi:flagellar capping protein FliD
MWSIKHAPTQTNAQHSRGGCHVPREGTDVSTSTTASVTTVIAGAFDRQIKNEQSSLAEMNKKQAALQTRLDEKQKSYYSQYSALNALLFKQDLNECSETIEQCPKRVVALVSRPIGYIKKKIPKRTFDRG